MESAESGHEAVEHTADLAIRAWAPDLRGLVEEAARGMLDVLLDAAPPAREQREVVGEGTEPEELLVDCLREILALLQVEGVVPVSVEVSQVREGRARCRVGVAPIGEARDALAQEIKAVTYHGLEIARREGGLEVTVVFDV